jgi:hypothetical protein
MKRGAKSRWLGLVADMGADDLWLLEFLQHMPELARIAGQMLVTLEIIVLSTCPIRTASVTESIPARRRRVSDRVAVGVEPKGLFGDQIVYERRACCGRKSCEQDGQRPARICRSICRLVPMT